MKPTDELKCVFCGAFFLIAWEGVSPGGFPLAALLCPLCASTKYTGVKEDPFFLTLQEMQKSIGDLWLALQKTEKQE